MTLLLAALLLAHALAHLVGFVVPWHLGPVEGMPVRTTILGGRVDVGFAGARAVGVLWLVTALAVAAVAVVLVLRVPWWHRVGLVTLAWSGVLCIVGWPDARIGLAVNVALIGAILAGGRLGWLPGTV